MIFIIFMYAALSVEVECFDPTLAHQGEKNQGLAQRLPIFTGSLQSFRGPKGFQDSIWFAKSKEMVTSDVFGLGLCST